MEPLATRYHRPCCPRFWLHCWATNHTIMQWLRLHTHPKLLAHQCGAHKRCLNHFICSGWAHGTGNPLPPPLLIQILTVGWKLGSHCWARNHTAIMQCLSRPTNWSTGLKFYLDIRTGSQMHYVLFDTFFFVRNIFMQCLSRTTNWSTGLLFFLDIRTRSQMHYFVFDTFSFVRNIYKLILIRVFVIRS